MIASIQPGSEKVIINETHWKMSNTQKASVCFLRAGSILTEPICLTSSFVHRVLSPMKPGRYDFADTAIKEKVHRAAISVGLLVLAPIGIITGVLGALLRFIGNKLQGEEFGYREGCGVEKPFTGEPFKLMTWNLCGIAGGMSRSHGGVLEWQKRIDGIVEQILKEDPDILCCQEVHDEALAHALREGLNEKYAHFFENLGPNTHGSNGGIFFATKFPPKDAEFITYRDADGSAKWINKGFGRLSIRDDKGKGFDVIGTHLQHAEVGRETRQKQLGQMLRHIEHLHKKSPMESKIPKFLAGDLNIDTNTSEPSTSLLFKHFKHGYTSSEPTCSDLLVEDLWEGKGDQKGSEERIDYISLLVSTPDGTRFSDKSEMNIQRVLAFEEEDLSKARSDHHALSGVIKV